MIGLITVFLSVLAHSNTQLPKIPTSINDKLRVLINGEVVPPGSGWDHVVSIMTGSAGCTATIVGKKVIVTAAHCAGTGATSRFKFNGRDYSAKMQRSPLYPRQDHDIAFGVVDSEIETTKMASLNSEELKKGDNLTILGYGCTREGGGGGNDGNLRKGDATIVNFAGFDAVSSNGAALCFGDSGGPEFVKSGTAFKLAAINSKGNIRDTNYGARLDMQQSKDFITNFITVNNVQICGINVECDGGPPPPPGQDFVMENAAGKMNMHVKKAEDVDFVKRAAEWFMKYIGNEK